MRVAELVKGYITAPPPSDIVYAPFDIAMSVADGLADRGHAVDFYAPEGSHLDKANLVTLGQAALVSNQQEFMDVLFRAEYTSHNVLALKDQRFAAEMFRRSRKGEYDVLHFHQPALALAFVEDNPNVPIVYTMHDPIDTESADRLRDYATDNQFLISISDAQRRSAPDLNYAATIYNGIDTDVFTPGSEDDKEDYLLYAARLVPEKGAKEAIEVAKATGKKLIMLGQNYPGHESYFDKYVAPFIDGEQIRYLGNVPRKETIGFYQKAAALLMPISWEEPFGLTMAEAMACDTPVIAFERGSVPEIVDDGVTGFIVDNVGGMSEAVGNLGRLYPWSCREQALARFSQSIMVQKHERVFEALISR